MCIFFHCVGGFWLVKHRSSYVILGCQPVECLHFKRWLGYCVAMVVLGGEDL